MTEEEKGILFSEEVSPAFRDCLVEVPVYDIEGGRTTGESVFFPSVWNRVEEKGETDASEMLLRYLFCRLRDDWYILWVPEYRGERFSLLAEKKGRRYLILLALDSESERKVWRLKENGGRYIPVVIRDREVREEGAAVISAARAMGSLNLLDL